MATYHIPPKPKIEIFRSPKMPVELRKLSEKFPIDLPIFAKWPLGDIAEKWGVSRGQLLTWLVLDGLARLIDFKTPWLVDSPRVPVRPEGLTTMAPLPPLATVVEAVPPVVAPPPTPAPLQPRKAASPLLAIWEQAKLDPLDFL